jgi:hypothetical protein
MLIEAWTPMQIASYFTKIRELPDGHPDKKEELDFDVNERQIYVYIDAAYELMEQTMIPKREVLMKRSIQRYEMLMRKALTEKDFRTALRIQERIDAMTGTQPKDPESESKKIALPPKRTYVVSEDTVLKEKHQTPEQI